MVDGWVRRRRRGIHVDHPIAVPLLDQETDAVSLVDELNGVGIENRVGHPRGLAAQSRIVHGLIPLVLQCLCFGRECERLDRTAKHTHGTPDSEYSVRCF